MVDPFPREKPDKVTPEAIIIYLEDETASRKMEERRIVVS
jgi:hypothetical protein